MLGEAIEHAVQVRFVPRHLRRSEAGIGVVGDGDEASRGARPEHDIDHAGSRGRMSGHVPGERQPAGWFYSQVATGMMQHMTVAADREAEPAADDGLAAQSEELVVGERSSSGTGRGRARLQTRCAGDAAGCLWRSRTQACSWCRCGSRSWHGQFLLGYRWMAIGARGQIGASRQRPGGFGGRRVVVLQASRFLYAGPATWLRSASVHATAVSAR